MKPRIIATTQAPELQQQEQQEQKNSSEATSASVAVVDFPRPSPVCISLGGRSSSGSYPLPGGGRLKLVDGGGNGGGGKHRSGGGASTSTLTVSAVPTAGLAGRSPPLQEQELLASPVYQVELANMRQAQRYRLALTLPVLRRPLPSQPPTQHLRLVGRPSDQPATSDSDDSERWTTMEVTEEDNKSITCIVTASGIYVAILSPLSETFQVSPNGALLNLKLDPIVSVRIPKRGCSEALDCCFSIIPFSDERLTLARRTHPSQTMDIRSLSPVYNFNYPGGEFKRPITLKLPLPQWLLSSGDSAGAPASAADSASVTIFYQPRPGLAEPWRILDPGSSLKLTKNSISFEARHLTRYCFASVSPTKVQRASLAMPLLCSWNTAMEGEILLFAKLEDRRWRLCVDCAPRNEIVERISDRVQAKGWLFLQSLQLQQQQQQQQEQQFSSFRRRPNSRRQADVGEESRRGAVRLRNGAIFIVRLAGSSDLALCQETETDNGPVAAVENCLRQVLVQYHQLLSDAPAIYRLVPTERCHTVATDFFDYKLQQQQQQQVDLDSGNRAADSAQENETINFKSQISVLDESGDLVSEHEIVLSFDAVKTYLGLRPPTPPPPPTPTPPPSPPPPTQRGSTATAGAATIKRIPTLPRLRLRVNELDAAQARIESFQRLTAPRRHLQAPTSTRESKALSVRSLQTLSEHVRQGLTLAVHLSLPESAITGIGFDVLSAGGATSVASVTYKILTHWKRSVPLPERGSMARQLADALASMGRPDLARVLLECDDANCELTPSLLAS